MNLKPNQKKFLKSIANNEVKDINSFISSLIDIDENAFKTDEYKAYAGMYGDVFLGDTPNVLILNNVDKAEIDLLDFCSLVLTLIKLGLILEIENKSIRCKKLLYKNGIGGFEEDVLIRSIVMSLEGKTIIPVPAFYSFIENDFQTEDELKLINENESQEDEKKVRDNSLKWTKLTAIISIFLAVGTTVFQFLTYSNEREVKITNIPKSDTIRAVIINNLTPVIDSTVGIKK